LSPRSPDATSCTNFSDGLVPRNSAGTAYTGQQLPTFFNKQVSCIAGPYDPILAPHDSEMLDFEGELVAVIGRRLRPGQSVRIEIEGIGTIENPVVAETPPGE
jgi:2-keto-4-pentenoate hydratase/2-oxohepta-3-ene-1,7-dioic acid hydratase in catechol pathway